MSFACSEPDSPASALAVEGNVAARFDPACGGDSHGDVAALSAAERADLPAFLGSW